VLHVWAVYLRASEEARRRGDRRTGTDHLLLAIFEDPSVESLLGVGIAQACQALEALDQEAIRALGMTPSPDAPVRPMRAVPKKPTFRDVMVKDRLRLTPAARSVLENSVRPNRRKDQVTAQQVLAQILVLQLPDPAAELLGALGVNTAEVRRRLAALTREGGIPRTTSGQAG
jgi:Clp amino terminal domain, pathogenicity island component